MSSRATSIEASAERRLDANAQRERSAVRALCSPRNHLGDGDEAYPSGWPASMPYLQNRLFTGARRDVIENIGSALTPRTYARKAVVFDEGDPAALVYLIDREAIRIHHNSKDGELVTSAIIGDPDLFGAEAGHGRRDPDNIGHVYRAQPPVGHLRARRP